MAAAFELSQTLKVDRWDVYKYLHEASARRVKGCQIYLGGPATPAGLIGHVSGTQYINWAVPTLPRVASLTQDYKCPVLRSLTSLQMDISSVHRRTIAPGLPSTLIELLETGKGVPRLMLPPLCAGERFWFRFTWNAFLRQESFAAFSARNSDEF